jgi:hypothetical protein
MGYDYVAVASDLGLLMRAAQAAAKAMRAMDGARDGAIAAGPAAAAPPQQGSGY